MWSRAYKEHGERKLNEIKKKVFTMPRCAKPEGPPSLQAIDNADVTQSG